MEFRICLATNPHNAAKAIYKSMANKMLTETEAMALAMANALKNKPSSFGANEASAAINAITPLLPNKIDAMTFGRVMTRLGNHSALRQWAIAHGFIVAPDDALSIATREMISELLASDVANLEEMTKA